jgi:hypothetical protein
MPETAQPISPTTAAPSDVINNNDKDESNNNNNMSAETALTTFPALSKLSKLVSAFPPIPAEALDGLRDEDWGKLQDVSKWCTAFVTSFAVARDKKEQVEHRVAKRKREVVEKPKKEKKVMSDEEKQVVKDRVNAFVAEALKTKKEWMALVKSSDDDAYTRLHVSFKMFTSLNDKTDDALDREDFVPKDMIITRAAIVAACESYFGTDKMKAFLKTCVEHQMAFKVLWDSICEKKLTWCTRRGRVVEYTRFVKENANKLKQYTENGSRSQYWDRYNKTWDAICGAKLHKQRRSSGKTTTTTTTASSASASEHGEEEDAASSGDA